MTLLDGLGLALFIALLVGTGQISAGRAVRARPAFALAAGWLVLHATMLQLDLFGFAWTRTSVVAATAFLAFGFAVGRKRAESLCPPARPAAGEPLSRERSSSGLGVGDLVALFSVVALFWAAATLRAPHSDFVYHWGVKARHFIEAQQIDRELLTYSLSDHLHPDYPQGLPDLWAAQALLQGSVIEGAWMAISAVLLLGIVLAARRCLLTISASRFVVQVAVATVAAGTAAFSVQYFQAGGPDLPLAFAVLLGVACLAEAAVRAEGFGRDTGSVVVDTPLAADIRLGLAAALAAALKVEGVVFSAVLLLVWWLAPSGPLRTSQSLAERAVRWGASIGPWVMVVTPWIAMTWTLDLWPARGGLPDVTRIGEVLEAAVPQFFGREWMGVNLVLLLLPAGVLLRKTRWLVLPLALQAAFYLWVYLSTPLDVSRVVVTTFPRLLLHLVPAGWLVAFVWMSQRGDSGSSGSAAGTQQANVA